MLETVQFNHEIKGF